MMQRMHGALFLRTVDSAASPRLPAHHRCD
jgi:hypothetical protein